MADRHAGPHLRLEGVSKRFGAQTAVNRIALDVPRGQFTTLLGPSGCGKTTLLRLIAGFFEPDEGRIVLNERIINNTPAHQRGTAHEWNETEAAEAGRKGGRTRGGSAEQPAEEAASSSLAAAGCLCVEVEPQEETPGTNRKGGRSSRRKE